MIGSAVSKVIFTAYIATMFLTPIAGYTYDVCGRRGPILVCMLGSIFLLFILPYTAPNFFLLIIARTLISMFFTTLETNPLVMDYIKSDSRGTALAYGTVRMLVGEAFGMIVLLGFSVSMSLEDAHAFAAVILVAMAIIGSFGLREPTIKEHEKIK